MVYDDRSDKVVQDHILYEEAEEREYRMDHNHHDEGEDHIRQ